MSEHSSSSSRRNEIKKKTDSDRDKKADDDDGFNETITMHSVRTVNIFTWDPNEVEEGATMPIRTG